MPGRMLSQKNFSLFFSSPAELILKKHSSFIFLTEIFLNLFGEWNSNKETSDVNAI